jgi:hypothetical protein
MSNTYYFTIVHVCFYRRLTNNNNYVQKVECPDNKSTNMYYKSEGNKDVRIY